MKLAENLSRLGTETAFEVLARAAALEAEGKSIIAITASPGQTVTLSAAGSSDPDGNKITYRWFQYLEAGTASRTDILRQETSKITFKAPNEPGRTVHIILELRDNGTPNLFAYRRTVVTLGDKCTSY